MYSANDTDLCESNDGGDDFSLVDQPEVSGVELTGFVERVSQYPAPSQRLPDTAVQQDLTAVAGLQAFAAVAAQPQFGGAASEASRTRKVARRMGADRGLAQVMLVD
jgi:hypothetical protein